jgi:hypothetical protein
LVFCLGILYHLKNPLYVLERLAEVSSYLFLSTRIARQFSANGSSLAAIPAAYLLAADESNNDATNVWIFTDGVCDVWLIAPDGMYCNSGPSAIRAGRTRGTRIMTSGRSPCCAADIGSRVMAGARLTLPHRASRVQTPARGSG